MKLQGATVFITGGGSGIGLALAEAFLAREGTVVICGRDEEKLTAARQRLPGLRAFRCDVADEADLREAARRIEEEFPALNILINNAGILEHHDYAGGAVDFATIDRELAVNLAAPAKLTHLLLPALRQNGEAAVVNITSGLALAPVARSPLYGATKAGLHSFSIALRRQLAGTGVKVFEALAPLVETAMSARQTRAKMKPARFAGIVLRNMERDRCEMVIGASKALYWLMRIAPGAGIRVLNRW